MLEVLLFTYQNMFGEPFPLAQFAGHQEYEVINIVYDCVSNNLPYDPERKVTRTVTGAPGMK